MAGCFVATRHETAPKGRERQRIQAKLDQGSEGHQRSASRRLAQHGEVFGAGAGDVVLARFGAALGHLGCEQRGVGGQQRAQAAPLLPHHHQLCHELRRSDGGLRGQQAVEQHAHAQDALAQLAQAKDQAHRDAVVLEVGVHRGGCGTARLQPLAQALGGFVEAVGSAQSVQHLHAQALHIADERMEGLCVACRFAHAQPQFGCKPGRENLPCTVGDGIEQRPVPARGAASALVGVVLGQQHHQAVQGGFIQCGQPLRVERAGQGQHEQFRRIDGLGAAGQQLGAQALGDLAHQGGAGRKAKVCEQCGDVHLVHQRRPPGTQPHLNIGARCNRLHEQLHPPHSGRDGIPLAAHPVQQVDQPQMAMGQIGGGVQCGQQVGEVFGLGGIFHGRTALSSKAAPPMGSGPTEG